MERLSADISGRFPDCRCRRLTDVRFEKFLHLDDALPIAAVNRVMDNGDGSFQATLATRFTARGARISRSLEHASMTLGRSMPPVAVPPLEIIATLAGVCTAVDPERIYTEMVPFGPAYRNIITDLLISSDGALARVSSPRPMDPRTDLILGSPYVLDAAFHAACVWCQRFCDCVAFPVSLAQRTVLYPTRLDGTYTARVVPVKANAPPFVFDIFIYDDRGRLCESAGGVTMRDVSGGRTRPPKGFFQPPKSDPLKSFATHVSAMVLLERRATAPFADSALSDNERERLVRMTATRAGGYLSARLALKRLSRMLSGDGDGRAPWEMETSADVGGAPRCPLADGSQTHCSVAHDRRFTIVVGAEGPVGVDVEPLSKRALDSADLFMDTAEKAVLDRSSLNPADSALRAWSAKEAAAKALGMELADAWSRVRITAIDEGHSTLEVAAGEPLKALHVGIEGHLFTLLVAKVAQ